MTLRAKLADLITREIEHQMQHKNGRIMFKMNALVDPDMIQLLYRASQTGVKIDLLIRGMCSLRPGLPNISENIRVRSIVGRFLEHSRVYWFNNNGAPDLYLGSADLMERNLDRRVETLFPIRSKALAKRVRVEVLELGIADNVKAWELDSDGNYARAKRGDKVVHSQMKLLGVEGEGA